MIACAEADGVWVPGAHCAFKDSELRVIESASAAVGLVRTLAQIPMAAGPKKGDGSERAARSGLLTFPLDAQGATPAPSKVPFHFAATLLCLLGTVMNLGCAFAITTQR